MFDIGFSELALIMVVALVVIGPERLPRLVRTAGLYLGRARRMMATVKADVKRELAAEDLKRTLQQQADSTGLHDIIEETRQTASAAEQLLKPEARPAVITRETHQYRRTPHPPRPV
jgi:sec-independent protein translocase protein TatB